MGAKIRLNGNLGDDPKSGSTRDGKPYISFSVYQPHWVNTGNKTEDGRNDFEDIGGFWMNVAWFGRKAEAGARVLRKGAAVLIEGDLRVEYWEDKQTGEQKAGWKVIATEVSLDMKGIETVEYRKRERHNMSPQPNVNREKPNNEFYPEPSAEDFDDQGMPF